MIDAPISDLISKDLRRWFKEKWVDVSRKDKDGKHPPCGRGEAKTDSKGYPKCRPSKKVSKDTPKTSRSMSPKEKKAATRRKRSKPQGVGGKPTIVKNIFDNISPQQARAMAFSLSSPFDYMDYGEEELPEVMMDNKDDPCCSAAKDKLAQAWADSNNLTDENHQILRDQFARISCEEFRSMLETDVTAQSMIRRGNPRGYEILERDRKIMAEWDECASESFSGDFTASADPFEATWDSINKNIFDNLPKDQMIEALAGSGKINTLRQMIESQFGERAEVKTDGGDDPCCDDVREKWSMAYSRVVGDAHYDIEEEGQSCDETREELEEWADGRFGENRTHDYGEQINRALQGIASSLLSEWDECAKESFSGDFTASADPFEATWDLISKDFYFDERGKRMGEGGTFVGPSAYGITQIDDAKGRRTGIKGLFSNRRRNNEAIVEDGKPSSQNTILTDDHINDTRNTRRFDTKPYDSSERKERGEDATPNDAQFRRGASLPRTKQVATDMPYYRAKRFTDMEGNEMDSKGKEEGWGVWDRTGKRQFRSDFNKPIHFEGQKRNYATHVGANLSTYGEGMQQGDYDEDEAIQRIASTLAHEHTHAAIDEDLKEAVKRGDLPSDHLAAAHEIGAHVGEYAELDDKQMEMRVNNRLQRHPNTSSFNYAGHTPEKFQGYKNQIKMPKMAQSSDDIKQASFDQAWSPIVKGRFHGYSRSSISDRPYRQAEHRVWDVSRKVKRERTKRRYARNKSRGTVRPAMRRQLGAGGKRASTKR